MDSFEKSMRLVEHYGHGAGRLPHAPPQIGDSMQQVYTGYVENMAYLEAQMVRLLEELEEKIGRLPESPSPLRGERDDVGREAARDVDAGFRVGDEVEDNEGDRSTIESIEDTGRIITDRNWRYWPNQITRVG